MLVEIYLWVNLYLPVFIQRPEDSLEIAQHIPTPQVCTNVICPRKGVLRVPHQFTALTQTCRL